MKKSIYPTAQSVLYDTCRIIMQNCKNNLALFTAFSALYTLVFVDAIIAAIDAAENMPSEAARALAHKTKRQELEFQAKDCRNMWQGLKRYITKAFSEEYWEMNWTAAGWADYEQASNDNWDKVNAMMVAGSQYIAAHTSELTAMPPGFPAEFDAKMVAFSAKYKEFTQAELDARTGTDEKITASNDLFKMVMPVCHDGQYIAGDDENMKQQFTFEKMSELVKPIGAAGLKGVVTKDGQPQAGLIVELENGDVSVITDAEGAFNFGNQLSSGTDTIVVKQGDQILAEEEVVIPAGVTKTEDVEIPSTPPTA
ncbi:MAG TPA: carboxypeptidase-like regulatory domain-containing protein [Bacteroidia bacterium]|nr:carboxypeptidase-like regulatory domain-containing protein [Bacteroidia bacterium]